MPHVIVKLYPGRSEEQKTKLADEIVKDVIAIAKCEEKSVSVLSTKLKKRIGPKKSINPIFSTDKTSYTKSLDIILLNQTGQSETTFLCL